LSPVSPEGWGDFGSCLMSACGGATTSSCGGNELETEAEGGRADGGTAGGGTTADRTGGIGGGGATVDFTFAELQKENTHK